MAQAKDFMFGKARGLDGLVPREEDGGGNKRKPKTEAATMLGLSPADIKQAIDVVDDLIQAAQTRCTDEVRRRQLRTLVLEYYRWRREEEH